jgi:uncharacterized protein (TIGR00255 family)
VIQSMTGYGAAEHEGFKVEVRSLNHRYIDINVRMPSFMMEHEIAVRNLIKENFARGKFDITISLTDKRQIKVRANKELAKKIYETILDLQKTLSVPGSLDISFLSWYREFLITEEPSYNAGDLYDAVRDAVKHVGDMRRKEGEALCKELESHAGHIESLGAEVEEYSRGMANSHKEILSRKVAELASTVSIDEMRLAQEVALLAQKSDITEELARLRSHIKQFNNFLMSSDAIGRKLDFLVQELYREANTIGSKVDDIRILNLVIEIKTCIEKLKEQVQNIQ